MEYRKLGRTGLTVSQLCFGALTVGPLQARLPLRDGAAVIRAALDGGVNFIDTAELYQTYDYIHQAIQGHKDVIITSKSYAWTYEGMRESVEKACQSLGRDYVDIFLLHEQTSRLTLKGHQEALRYLIDAKQQGIIRAIGVSTHTVDVVRAVAMMDEVDVIHPILNMVGIGIIDGTVEDMLIALAFAAVQGKGIYTMKALGGGHLSHSSLQAIKWILSQKHIASIAVGMQSIDEVLFNIAAFGQQAIDVNLALRITARQRRLLVEDGCIGCGRCVLKCPMEALYLEEDQVHVDMSKCILCGYCGAHCPEFALKIV